jgi:hypothetical protein
MAASGQPHRRTGHHQVIKRIAKGLEPWWLQAYFLIYTPLGLFADSRVTAVWQQDMLGALTFLALLLASLKVPRHLRVQVWTCVAVATGFEVVGSLVWGVYRYRLHNLPLFVPPGHGIVYLFGLLAAQTPLVERYGRRVAYAVLGAAVTWAALGLTVLPLSTGRLDVQGALCLPVFAYFLLRSPRWPLFAAIFIVVSELEICGTTFGDWQWMAVAPWTHIPSGNPPSVIAGGYCVIDGSVLVVMWFYRWGLNTIMTRITTTMIPSPGPNLAPNPASRLYSGDAVSPASANRI